MNSHQHQGARIHLVQAIRLAQKVGGQTGKDLESAIMRAAQYLEDDRTASPEFSQALDYAGVSKPRPRSNQSGS